MDKKKKKIHKSCWNYRFVAEKDNDGTYFYSIRDVYYTKEKPTSWGAEPQHSVGETTNDVFNDLNLMLEAVNKPLLVIVGSKLVEHHKKSSINAKAEEIKLIK